MADRDDEELQIALRMSLQGSPPAPEAKRSKAAAVVVEESPEMRSRGVQRELMVAVAEKRMRSMENKVESPARPRVEVVSSLKLKEGERKVLDGPKEEKMVEKEELDLGEELSMEVVDELFVMVFGSGVSMDILVQWTNQGIRFSSDPETCMGLVQHEGGPCGVLAAIQAFVLKYLMFVPEDMGLNSFQTLGPRRRSQSIFSATSHDFASITEDRMTRALVHSMVEILFMCGSNQKAAIATLNVSFNRQSIVGSYDSHKNEMITKSLKGLSIESASDFQKILRVKMCASKAAAYQWPLSELPVFRSRMGTLLFLISALLSRGLESIPGDGDDPSLPLVTAPFGHASQEIVNLLLCGRAVPNVFDGRMDLGGDMFLNGIPTSVDIGFLTLLESLNFCKVGHHQKCPKWPIWVLGSESHYTVLFALDPSVQEENELEERESHIRKVFDSQDQSGGGGFISVEGFHHVLREANINFPPQKLDGLMGAGFIVWSEFWQALLELDKSLGGFKDSSGLNVKKVFNIYHFNGIAKSVIGGESPLQRPRLCKLSVSVPPRWNQDEYKADVAQSSSSSRQAMEVNQFSETCQYAPLVDCIRTRWPRARCSWVGDAPSII